VAARPVPRASRDRGHAAVGPPRAA
jgi:hypothetical protein